VRLTELWGVANYACPDDPSKFGSTDPTVPRSDASWTRTGLKFSVNWSPPAIPEWVNGASFPNEEALACPSGWVRDPNYYFVQITTDTSLIGFVLLEADIGTVFAT
jgi:hypothetical protein